MAAYTELSLMGTPGAIHVFVEATQVRLPIPKSVGRISTGKIRSVSTVAAIVAITIKTAR